MKVHYLNILLFAVPLNILVINTHKKPSITPRHIQTNRLLCECELFAPQNYDNDPEIKRVMQQFYDRTTQRFQEYDEKLQEKRQIYKDKCDKEIQKIILKDKLEKELTEKLAALQNDITTNDIPTCVCEKSVADKVEKGCLRCAQNLGGIVAPSSGALAGIAEGALYAWKNTALDIATKYATARGLALGEVAGDIHGMKIVITYLEKLGVKDFCPDLFNSIGTKIHYTNAEEIAKIIVAKHKATCNLSTGTSSTEAMCEKIDFNFGMRIRLGSRVEYGPPVRESVPKMINNLVDKATEAADIKAAQVSSETTAQLTTEKTGEIAATYATWHTTIIAAVVAIVVIVLIMVIIYLILRYRRKKKMKKKLQYIKLLEE